LTRREHSRKELLDKMALRGFDRQMAEAVIAELAEQGWQSDSRYAQSYARDRINKGYGPIRIAYEVKQRGGTAIDLDGLVAEIAGGWDEVLERVYQRKYDDEKRLSASDWQKRSRFLQQRGFSGEQIRNLFAQLQIKLTR
jgi:regulatory protein